MAINFPDSPSLNQTYTNGSYTWIWNGTAWDAVMATAVQGVQGPSGPQGIQGDQGLGLPGIQGVQGLQGLDGLYAAQGIQGIQGSVGQIDLADSVPPTAQYPGQIWFDTSSVKTYVWYDNYWIEVASSAYTNQYLRAGSSATTSSLTAGTSENVTITGYKSYALMSVTTSAAAWVVLYTDTTSRSADSTRGIGSDPVPGQGVVAEVITSGAQTYNMSPFVFGGNLDSPTSTNIYAKITNLGTTTTAITVTLNLLRLEI